MKLVGGQDPKG